MLSAILLLFVSNEPVDCPPRNTLARQEAWYPGKICKDDVDRAKLEADRIEKLRVPPPQTPPAPLSAAAKTQIQQKLDLILKDGASARFLWQTRLHADFYCGFVNAKNSMGGYVGWNLFSAHFDRSAANGQVVAKVSLSADDEASVRLECARHGYATSPG